MALPDAVAASGPSNAPGSDAATASGKAMQPAEPQCKRNPRYRFRPAVAGTDCGCGGRAPREPAPAGLRANLKGARPLCPTPRPQTGSRETTTTHKKKN